MPMFSPATVVTEIITSSETPCGPARMLRFSDSGGLTQFGAYVEILPPASRSSLRHWHQNEDEMIYLLSGQVTVHEGDSATALHPGQAATFKASVPLGHYLRNDGDTDATYLVIGTRLDRETCVYPDHDRIFHRDGDNKSFTTLDGTPGVGSAYSLPGA